MSHGNALSRGDVRRNAFQRAMREVVGRDRAIVAIDLADDKQVVAVCDHDNVVLARRTVRCRAWQLAETLTWACEAAVEGGFLGVVVGCEPDRAPLVDGDAAVRPARLGPGLRAAAVGAPRT